MSRIAALRDKVALAGKVYVPPHGRVVGGQVVKVDGYWRDKDSVTAHEARVIAKAEGVLKAEHGKAQTAQVRAQHKALLEAARDAGTPVKVRTKPGRGSPAREWEGTVNEVESGDVALETAQGSKWLRFDDITSVDSAEFGAARLGDGDEGAPEPVKADKGDRVKLKDGTVIEVAWVNAFGDVKGHPVNPETGAVQTGRKERRGQPVEIVAKNPEAGAVDRLKAKAGDDRGIVEARTLGSQMRAQLISALKEGDGYSEQVLRRRARREWEGMTDTPAQGPEFEAFLAAVLGKG